jgi:type IX secretion system PorP/SprF family membrane protein
MRRIIYITGMILAALVVRAQDLQMTQFYSSPLYLNPAFTGANADSRIATSLRNQWCGLPGTYKSFLLSYDYFLQNYHCGLGGFLMSDKAGTQGLSNNMLGASYAYDYKFHRYWSASIGIRAAYGWRSLDFSSLLFGDQIARNSATSLQNPFFEKVNFFDISTGAIVFSSMEWIGISFNHINRPDESFLSDNAAIPVKGSVHGGINFPLGGGKGDGRMDEKPVIITAFQYRFQKKFDQFDIGLYLKQPQYFFGIWYRGLPGFKAYKPGYSNHDCIALLIGAIYKKNLILGYSYDITISQLGMSSGGSHEISLNYNIDNPNKPKKTRAKIIPCPKI